MKNLKTLLILAFITISNLAFSQSDCEKDKQDLAQIISGSYKCEISIMEYGVGFTDKNGNVEISKIGENKVKISFGGDSYTINGLHLNGNTSIEGDEPTQGGNDNKMIRLNIYEKPAKINGSSASLTSETMKKGFSFNGVSNDNNKPESLNSEPACKEILMSPNAKFGGKIIKKRDVKLCILGVAYDKPGTIDVKKAADEQQISDVLILDIPFPEDEAWKNSDYEVQTKRYWDETNKPFIDDAIAQNAEIRYVTDPRLEENKYSKKNQQAQHLIQLLIQIQ
ncbi:hypothetical protein [Flavobacterium sp.]|uniref:hypothetical protein n=1 Tax=Flavobacterium sp. TaxID=239 RepID=UPI00286C2DD3|nr:hypothetical protein [Flavobacterium sp.]